MGDSALLTRRDLVIGGNNMVTKFNGHQVEYQSIESFATLLIMF